MTFNDIRLPSRAMLREEEEVDDDGTRYSPQACREANKTCGVCGDRALGCNFNVVTCESCKAFFRRNALKMKEFRCPFNENCQITPITRRFCQKCRLDKCFEIGMKKELIMSEEDKVLKRQKIAQNRAKKRPGPDNRKTVKSKRESIDDPSFDDTSTSVPSVASVASVASESYFWESDRKYADLDAKKQPTIDSMSPITAASVPSPSSPPESCDIVGTKTLEMLKDSSAQMSIQTFVMDDHSVSYSPLDLNIEKNFSSQINFDTNSSNAFEQDKEQALILKMNEYDTAGKPVEKSCKLVNSSAVTSSKNLGLETYLSSNSTFKPILEERQYMTYPECKSSTKLIESCVNQISSTVSQSNIKETIACQKSKEIRLKDSNAFFKAAPNPELISKLIQSPSVMAKIFQDHDLMAKFITDPAVLNKLTSDPQISPLLEENISNSNSIRDNFKYISVNTVVESLADSEMSNSNMSEILKNHVEHPILTNLITTQHIGEHRNRKINVTANSDNTKNILQEIQREPISANTLESILCEAIKLEYSPYSTMSSVPTSKELNDAERAKLNELIVANKALVAPLEEDITNLVGNDCNLKEHANERDPKLLGVINLTATAIRRLIKMSKKISAFKNMCQEDQLALLKGGCTEMMILRSAINYDPDKETWNIPHSRHRMANIKVDVLKEANGNLYGEHKKFVRTFDSRWRDENIVLILCAIALFSPERPRVVHSDVIKLEQNSYYYLLRRYLESMYPGCEAKSNFLKLIQKMSELHKLNKEVTEVYLNVNPSSVEPLLIEIFDLKN